MRFRFGEGREALPSGPPSHGSALWPARRQAPGEALHGRFAVSWIDHGKLYSDGIGVHTNGAEEFFSRMRRAEIGHHHHIAGTYLLRVAQERVARGSPPDGQRTADQRRG